jgi:FMN phosphatase YigB (HAD superfamily)
MLTQSIKVIVFDLDGTLYEDTHHFHYYAKRLQDKLPLMVQDKFDHDYRLFQEGKHALKIGRVYDVEKDLILVQLDGIVQEAYQWDGTPLEKEKIKLFYPKPITIDLDSMLNVGDLWWVPASIARHYGLTNEESYQAFLETRKYMMTPEFQMTKIPGLKETLEEISDEIKLVLMTNSPKQDSEVILSKLDLHQVFHKKIFMAKKPTLTQQHFASIKKEFNVDYEQILSIGDNWLNEILPAKKLGCSTILIDSHQIADDQFADIIVSTISKLIPVLKKLKTC